jgi:hypothetical protein
MMQTKTEKLADTRTADERAAGVLSPQCAAEFHALYGFTVRTNSDIAVVFDHIGIKAALEAEREPEPEPEKSKKGRRSK